MKTILTSIAALVVVGASNSWATATIDMNNYGSSASPVFYVKGVLLPVENAYVQLVVHVGDDWQPVSRISDDWSAFPLTEPGFFNGGVCRVPGVADYETVEFTLRAWIGAASYDTAEFHGSVTWRQATGSWVSAAQQPTGPDLNNPPLYFNLPEPSTIILGLMGGATVVLIRRKAGR